MIDKKNLAKKSKSDEISAFLSKVAATPVIKAAKGRGRLIFAMDATASRGPMWDRACHIQGQMFTETAALGGLEVQLCHYQGFMEFYASPWLTNGDALLKIMSTVTCVGGQTQIEKVLRHTVKETKQKQVDALVFVGDCMEESADTLSQLAGELGILKVPVFIFHEGFEPQAESAFKQIARLSNGAYCRFDTNSVHQLRELLSAVAVYAAGGRRALADFSKGKDEAVLKLAHQVRRS